MSRRDPARNNKYFTMEILTTACRFPTLAACPKGKKCWYTHAEDRAEAEADAAAAAAQ